METIKESKRLLESFINACINKNVRCILVITGKKHIFGGARSFKRKLPACLQSKPLLIKSGHSYAINKDGADGARYILLRKRKRYFMMNRRQKRKNYKRNENNSRYQLDGTGKNSINTGIGFLNILKQLSKHSNIDINLKAKGDYINHIIRRRIQDMIGQLMRQWVLKRNIGGYAYVPMDETLTRVVIDLSGRPFNLESFFHSNKLGEMDKNCLKNGFNIYSSYRAQRSY